MADDFVVGCPVFKRDWVLPQWFKHVEDACQVADVEPTYAFIVDPLDQATIDVIADHPGNGFIWARQNEEDRDDVRDWSPKRFHWMVDLRNELLEIVRSVQPSWFLSVDSDILLHRDAIKNMLETADSADAVGGKLYLSEVGRDFPSNSKLMRDGGLKRYDSDEIITVECIMALKLMTPVAYNVDYTYHVAGEDIGWSLNCKTQGLTLKWDGRVGSKHVMHPDMLGQVDRRVGY